MDPISAAGIGLSVSSLVLQAFAGCIKGYQLFLEAEGMPEAYQSFRTRLQIEQIRLANWGQQVGLVEELLDTPSQTLQFNRNLILDILLEVQKCFRSCTKTTAKYDKHVTTAGPPGKGSKDGVQLSFLQKTLARIDSPAKLTARLQWAMVKQEESEKLIGQLIGYNNRILEFLDRHAMEDLRLMQQKSNLMLLQLTEQVGQLQILAGAMQFSGKVEVDVQVGATGASAMLASTDSDQRLLASLATFKALQLSAETEADAGRKLLVSRKEVQVASLPTSQSRATATFRGKPVWVEWREVVDDYQPKSKMDLIIQDRIAKLAALLSATSKPKALGAPECLAYFQEDDSEDQAHFGLVFDSPRPSIPSPIIIFSLRDLFSSVPTLPLRKRIALACTLSESLLYLHAVNWLHKGVRSDSVLFFPETETSLVDDTMLSTLLLSGFDFSRPDLPDELTVQGASNIQHDMYRHPSQHRSGSATRSQKSHDIYSLGVVLTEIALWSPIETIAQIPLGTKAARNKIHGIRDVLLSKDISARLGDRVGETYARAVEACLLGGEALGISLGEDEAQPETGVRMQQAFYEVVLAKLRQIKV